MGLLWVAGRLPSLNQVIEMSAGANSGWSKYGEVKKKWSQQIVLMARVKNLQPIPPSYFGYLCCEPNRRADPSNIVGGAVKVIEDALQMAGLLQNDGWNDILGYVGYWQVAAHRVGTLVYWGPSLPSKQTMETLWQEEIGTQNGHQSESKDRSGPRATRDARRGTDDSKAPPGE